MLRCHSQKCLVTLPRFVRSRRDALRTQWNLLTSNRFRHRSWPRCSIRKELNMANGQRIRIRLKGYDFRMLDQSALEIVETAKRTGAKVAGGSTFPARSDKL